MNKPMHGIIYKSTCPDGRVYIGQTTYTLAIRKRQHAFRTKKGDRRTVFHVALLEQGFESFEWEQIDTAENKIDLDQKERYWIAHYQSDNPAHGYNLQNGGTHYTLSPEHRRKIGDANRGRVITDTTRQKLREARKGKKHAPESRSKMREAWKRRKAKQQKTGEIKTPWNKGRVNVYSDETRQRMSEAAKRRVAKNKRDG